MASPQSPAVARAAELRAPPPPGAPYSVPIEGSEREGRSAVYRHWRCKDELVYTLDPEVRAFRLYDGGPGADTTLIDLYRA